MEIVMFTKIKDEDISVYPHDFEIKFPKSAKKLYRHGIREVSHRVEIFHNKEDDSMSCVVTVFLHDKNDCMYYGANFDYPYGVNEEEQTYLAIQEAFTNLKNGITA